jgi:hypothetical protein
MATLPAFPSSEPISGASAERVDMKLEVVVIPVADVDRSKGFYTKLGWRLDADFPHDNVSGLSNSRRLLPGARFSLGRR